MANVNKVFLIGRLTADPELRYTPSGAAVSDLRLAANRVYNTKEGERREDVLYIDVTVWNRQAENCCQYLRKGRQVHIEGYLKMESWDDKATGEKRSKIKVEADNVQFLDSRQDGPAGSPGSQPSGEFSRDDSPVAAPTRRAPITAAANGSAPARVSAATAPAPRVSPTPPADEDEEVDDIPF